MSQSSSFYIYRSDNNTYPRMLLLEVNEVICIKLVRTIFGINKNSILNILKNVHSTGSVGDLSYLIFY